MIQIDWSILGQGQAAGDAFGKAFDAGRARAKTNATENVLAQYAAAPSMNALAPLAALDPQSFSVLAKNEREQEATRLAAKGRSAYSQYLRERRPEQVVPGGPAPTDVAPALSAEAVAPAAAAVAMPAADALSSDAEMGEEVLVTGRRPRPQRAPTVSIADVAEFDPDLAANLTKHMGALGEEDRNVFAQKTGVGAAVAMAAMDLKPEERRAFLDNQYPLLKSAGWSPDELDAFDPSDDNLRAVTAIGVGADKYLADQRAEAGQRVTVRGQDVSAATSRRGQDIGAATARSGQAVTMRGQDIGAATARSGQAVTMRGQNIASAGKAAPKPATIALAKSKLTALGAIDNQLNRVEAALKKAKYKGPVGGLLPGGISGSDSAADAAIRQLAPLIRQLTRVPGEGAMSDYESRLAEAGQPSRRQTPEGLQETLAGYRDLIRATRAGYRDLAGETPSPADNRGFKVRR